MRMTLEKCTRRRVFVALAAMPVVTWGIATVLFMFPSERFGLFFSYLFVYASMALFGTNTVVAVVLAALLLRRSRTRRAVLGIVCYFAVYVFLIVAGHAAVWIWASVPSGR